MGATFTPSQVTIGAGPTPYINPISNGVNAEAVRASGSGPGDAAYRQNLATYEGGLFARPGGSLTFNPTGDLFGNPSGAGNAPLPGMPTGLLDQALAGMGYSTPQPQQQGSDTGSTNVTSDDSWRTWLDKFRDSGSLFRIPQ